MSKTGAHVKFTTDLAMNLNLLKTSKFGERDWALYFTSANIKISPWNDIPLKSSGTPFVYNFVNEIPLNTREKLEMCKKTQHNPIKHDTILYNNKYQIRRFKKGASPFNYGFLPQTWEDNKVLDRISSLPGDDDPIDVVEISGNPLKVGQICQVKVLGCLCLIDSGETDWKIICIDLNNEISRKIHSVSDVDKYFPEKIDLIRNWFETYKILDGKEPNRFFGKDRYFDADFAKEVIEDGNECWKRKMCLI